ncbi:hypothetical protein [Viridibacillus arvi]|uniref:hypothetical protein n=1 Tax=Viridibacillus arvi TaxID=263475 RepID=UPI0034CDA770
MITKEFAKIGKSMIRQLSSVIEQFIFIEDDEIIHEALQEPIDCETTSLDSYMPEVDLDENKEPQNYYIKHHRLSKSQILQFIVYHFFAVDQRGVICHISEKEIAETINCTVKTVRNNNAVLSSVGLINFSHSRTASEMNVQIIDFPKYFETNGFGYMELNFERFKEISNIEHVNSLRLELRKELVYDNAEIKRQMKKDTTPSSVSFNDYKNITPKYAHYKGMMKQVADKGTSSFVTMIQGNNICFKLAEGKLNGKALKQKKRDEYKERINNYIQEQQCKILFKSNNDIDDLIQLSFEYSVERVMPALVQFINEEHESIIEFIQMKHWGILFDVKNVTDLNDSIEYPIDSLLPTLTKYIKINSEVNNLSLTNNIGGKIRTIIRQQLDGQFLPSTHFAS